MTSNSSYPISYHLTIPGIFPSDDQIRDYSVSARKASEEIHISYKSALKAYEIIRRAITEYLANTERLDRTRRITLWWKKKGEKEQ